MSAAPAEPTPGPTSSRRGCWGSVVSSGCGCLAFLVGAGLAIAAAAPQLLSGWGARAIERYVEARIDGEVEVFGLELHWNRPQRARRVVISAPPGEGSGKEKVAEFALRFPSLFDLLDDPTTEWIFKITDAELTVRVNEDGTSDLGRMMGIDAADGRSEAVALFEALGKRVGPTDGEDQRSVRTTINVRRARFIDKAPGAGSDRTEATISNLAIVASRSRVGYQVEWKDAQIGYDGTEKPAVSFSLSFGGPVGTVPVLERAKLKADPVPLATLRLLGLVPRSPAGAASGSQTGGGSLLGGVREAPSRDAYEPMAEGLLAAAAAFFKEGASIDASYGVVSAAGVATDSPGAPVSVTLDGPAGKFKLVAVHQGDWLVADSAQGQDNALEVSFGLAPGQLARFMTGLVPPESIVFEEARPGAQWSVRTRSLHLPLTSDALSVDVLFGERGAGTFGEDEGASRRSGPGRARLGRRVAAALKRADADIAVTSLRSEAPALVLWPHAVDKRRPVDRLDWTHSLTKVVLSGELGASVQSSWRVAQAAPALAKLSLSIPGTALLPGEDLSPRLDVSLPAVSLAILEALTPLPPDLAVLLPGRFDRLRLEGIGMPQLLEGPARIASQRRRAGTPIRVKALLDGTDRIEGQYVDGIMTIPAASVTVPLDQTHCDRIIRAYMPWLARVQPPPRAGEEQALQIDLRDFVFSMGSEDFEQEGEVELRFDPLRVQLQPVIAAELCASDRELKSEGEEGDDGGWIAWTSPPIRLSMAGLFVRYERVELPISDEYVANLDGHFDREAGSYSLSGLVESDFIQGLSEGDALRFVAINGKSIGRNGEEASTATVTFSRGTIDPEITELVRKATEIGEKAK